MTNIDISTFSNMTKEQLVVYCHNMTGRPSLITVWLFTMASLLIIGLSSVEKKRKFMAIFILTFVVSGIFLASLYLLPNAWQNVFHWLGIN